jgi:HSP20 family molecular chaperone IbpA
MLDDAEGLEERLTREVGDAVDMVGRPQPVPVNMYESRGALVIVAPLPGVMADDVEVGVEPGRVIIRAAMRTAAPKDYLLHEWHYGPYERALDVPEGFGGAATATFGNGQLAVSIAREGERTAGPIVISPAD